jgi:hypothetical protein
MKEQTTKGLVHAALALASAVETKHASGPRRFLLGLATGWHVYAAFYHLVQEADTTYPVKETKKEPKKTQALWNKDCLYWRGKILTGEYSHYCNDWDGLPIDETTPEWPCCCEWGEYQ